MSALDPLSFFAGVAVFVLLGFGLLAGALWLIDSGIQWIRAPKARPAPRVYCDPEIDDEPVRSLRIRGGA